MQGEREGEEGERGGGGGRKGGRKGTGRREKREGVKNHVNLTLAIITPSSVNTNKHHYSAPRKLHYACAHAVPSFMGLKMKMMLTIFRAHMPSSHA